MTAFVLLLALVGGAASYYAWAAGLVERGVGVGWMLVGAPVAYLAPVALLTALWLFLSWLWRTPRPPGTGLSASGVIRLYATEAKAIAASWPLLILHRLLLRDPPPAPASLPVILVHGVLVNDGVWFGFQRYLIRRALGPVYTFNYGPPFADIEHFASRLAEKVDDVCAATGAARVLLIGHSMGGLVARAYLRRYGGGRVAGVISIGTPHHGSRFAWLWFGRCLAQMRPGNPWLADLNRDEQRVSAGPFRSIWSRHDTMVAPQASAVLACAENVAFIGIGHNALLGSRDVMELVATQIAAARVRASDAAIAPRPLPVNTLR